MKASAEDYKSYWQHKKDDYIKEEISRLRTWASLSDKYAQKDDLKSSDKIDILISILEDRA